MNNKIKVLISVFVLSGIAFGYTLIDRKLSTDDIRKALYLIDINIKDEHIETLKNYLSRNRKGYKELRGGSITNDVKPAVAFRLENERAYDYDLKFDLKEVELPKDYNDLAFFSIRELAYLIKNKKITSQELTKIFLHRINKYNKKINAVVTLTDSVAFLQAKEADEEIASGIYRGPLHGIPYGIKDLASYPGYPTTWGANPYKNQILDEKANVIKRLEESGAVMLCKLSSGSLARGDVWHGGKTLNPWDLDQGSSGSSAGSASATAASLLPFTIGTETLGSIISPSTRCGVTGLRPTYGSVSTDGFMTLSWSMDKVGPIAKSAVDCALVFNEIKKNHSSTLREEDFKLNSKKLKIGYLKNLFDEDTSRYKQNNQLTLDLIKETFNLTPIRLPTDYPFGAFDIILRAEAGTFFDSFILNNLDSTMVEQGERSRANSLRQSRLIPAVEYIQANRYRSVLIEEVKTLFESFDIILSPSFGKNQLMITNLTGHPAISVPNGFDNKKRPTSISLIGNYYEEHKILYFADILQNKTNYHKKIPPGFE